VDVGGTFSDFVRWDGDMLQTGKVSSTPQDQSVGVIQGAAPLGPVDRFFHGTTVATNALLERRGAATALVTSVGFGDIIEIGRQDRPALYDSFEDRPPPLVPPELRFEVADEADWVPPSEVASADAVAVSLLYGYERADAESALVGRLRAALGSGVPIAASSVVVPEFREYERTLTTVLNAYLAPETGRYLRRLVERCNSAALPEDVLVMRSSGGLIPIAEAVRLPAAILLSGPAGGVMAAAALGSMTGRSSVISFDMGGTSTDVCRIENGMPEVAYERSIAGYPCRLPSVAIHTVGAGGGSIAWADTGGALRVGPQSSGASPGPAAYGRGGAEPTVTDANVMLGRIPADAVLAGGLELRADLAAQALARLGDALGLGILATARGVGAVVEEVMAGAIRKVSIEQGADPRQATLVAFGGAGGLHATALAKRLGMAGVLVPLHAGVFSALGLLLSPPRMDVAQSVLLQAADDAALDRAVDGVVAVATDRHRHDVGDAPTSVETSVDVRYLGQAHEVSVPYGRGTGWRRLASDFHRLHHERNGFARPDDPIEVVTVRAAATGRAALDITDVPTPAPVGDVVTGVRPVDVGDGTADAEVVSRAALAPGMAVTGPAIIEEAEATTYLAPGDRAFVHESGALEVEW
jgi:N-methylhydantoinase A